MSQTLGTFTDAYGFFASLDQYIRSRVPHRGNARSLAWGYSGSSPRLDIKILSTEFPGPGCCRSSDGQAGEKEKETFGEPWSKDLSGYA